MLWSSCGPVVKHLATLSLKGLIIYEVATLRPVRTLPRKGFFQQLAWSPDGQHLLGVSNGLGESWTVARMALDSGKVEALSMVDSCTPDWFPDSRQVIFSNRPPQQRPPGAYGWTQLWRVDVDTRPTQLVYAEDGRHVYGGVISPDGKYVVLTGNAQEDGDPSRQGAEMHLLRLRDTPMIHNPSPELRARFPDARTGPRLALPRGFEPCWTARDILAQDVPTP